MKKQVPGFYLWVNLVIAIVYDFGVQGIALVLFLAGVGTGGTMAALGIVVSKTIYVFAVFLTYLFRYLHNSRELTPYSEEKQTEVKALRKRASKLQAGNAQIARKGGEVSALMDQQADKIKDLIIRSFTRKIWAFALELAPILASFLPTFTISAFYDLRELKKERRDFKPIESEIRALEKQVKNAEQTSQKGQKNTASRKNIKQQVQKARDKAKQAGKNKQTQSAKSRSPQVQRHSSA